MQSSKKFFRVLTKKSMEQSNELWSDTKNPINVVILLHQMRPIMSLTQLKKSSIIEKTIASLASLKLQLLNSGDSNGVKRIERQQIEACKKGALILQELFSTLNQQSN